MFVRMRRNGIIVLPKSVLEKLQLSEDTVFEVEIRGREIVLRPVDLWERVWGRAKGFSTVEEAEQELAEG